MKRNHHMKSIAIALLVTGFSFLSLIPVTSAQDTAMSEKAGNKGIVVLKIKKDVNGKSTVIDTTFTINSPSGQRSLEEYLRKHEEELDVLSDNWNQQPGSYNYRFEFPCPEEFDFPEPGDDGFFEMTVPEGQMKIFRDDKRKGNLSDILGNIPMDRVKSYSVREKKNGKRIIIDLEDEPVIERHERTIIIHNRGGSSHKGSHPGKEM